MKTCSKCHTQKSFGEFAEDKKSTDGRQIWCRECKRRYDRARYARADIRAKKLEIDRLAREERQRFVFSYLQAHPCVDCGESDPIVLEFDHVRGVKVYSIADIVRRRSSIARIRAEIEKCEVRCANCHRRKTAREHGYFVFRATSQIEFQSDALVQIQPSTLTVR